MSCHCCLGNRQIIQTEMEIKIGAKEAIKTAGRGAAENDAVSRRTKLVLRGGKKRKKNPNFLFEILETAESGEGGGGLGVWGGGGGEEREVVMETVKMRKREN